MMLQDEILEAVFKNVRVYLGGGGVSMAQKSLDHAKVGAPGKQVRGKGVSQGVRSDLAW